MYHEDSQELRRGAEVHQLRRILPDAAQYCAHALFFGQAHAQGGGVINKFNSSTILFNG